MPVPALNPAAAPRQCRTQRDGRWEFKRRYRSTEEIPFRIREDPSTDHYCCRHCGHWHVGRSRRVLNLLGDLTALQDLNIHLLRAAGELDDEPS